MQIPIHSRPDKFTKPKYHPENVDYYYDASIEGDILHLTFFDRSLLGAEWRVFFSKDGWINYHVPDGKWGTAQLCHLGQERSEYWHSTKLVPISQRAKDAGAQFFPEDAKGKVRDDSHEILWCSQNRIQGMKSARIYKKRRQEREDIFADWPTLPEGWQQRLEDEPWRYSKYCFFHKRKKDDLSLLDDLIEKQFPGTAAPYIGQCSACGKSFPLDYTPKHEAGDHNDHTILHPITCPHCGSVLRPKEAGRGRSKLWIGGYYTLATEREGRIYIDIVWADRSYNERPTKTKFYSSYRYLLDTTENKAYRWNREGGNWRRVNGLNEPTVSYCNNDTSFAVALNKTRLSYCRSIWQRQNTLRAVCHLTAYPCLEFLERQGFSEWVDAVIQGSPYIRQIINVHGKNRKQVLGMTINEARRCYESCKTPAMRLFFKKLRQENRWLSEEDRSLIGSIYNVSELLKLCSDYGTGKSLDYLKKQQRKYPKHGAYDLLISWRDYLQDCRKLGYDMTDQYNVMPPDIMKAHVATTQLVQRKANEMQDAKILERLPYLEERYHFSADGFLIRPAQNSGELIIEGAFLHHCVGSYAAKYANGKTDILLLRSAEDPDVPLVTAEYQKGKRIQVRAHSNKNPSPEVMAFVAKFEEYLKHPSKEVK